MLDLIVGHLFENSPAAWIGCTQAFHMAPQMRFHLPLRLGDEPQVGPPSERAGKGAYCKGTGIPQGIQEARPAAQFAQTELAPGEMIGLFGGCLAHGGRNTRIAGGQCLTLV